MDTENVKEKLIKTVEDAKTTYQRYEEKCKAKEVGHDSFSFWDVFCRELTI